jgi:antitoxin component YwqK of YwqJK toxin-antitoxin module
MKRLLGLLLVMGMVGCGAPEWVERDGLMYEGDSETPFTGVAVVRYTTGQKRSEGTYKDGKQEGLVTWLYESGKKRGERTYKDGKLEGLATMWHKNGQKRYEETYKDGKKVSETKWDEEGNEIKKTRWDEEGNEIKD